MHVHFHEFQVADADDRIADGHQFFFEFVYIRERRLFFEVDDEKFRAVGKFDFPEIEIDDIRIVAERVFRIGSFGFVYGGLVHLFAVENGQKSAVHAQKPHAARVHDARFFQNGQKFGRLGERLFALFDDRV